MVTGRARTLLASVPSVGSTGATFSATSSEDGTVYYVTLLKTDAAPLAGAIKDQSVGTVAGGKGTLAATANTATSAALSGLVTGVEYVVYAVAVDAAGSFVGAVVATEFTPSCDVTGCNLCPVAGECVECSGTFWLSGDKKSCAAGPITYPETPTTDCSKVTTPTCNGYFSGKWGVQTNALSSKSIEGTTTGCAPLGVGGNVVGGNVVGGTKMGFSLGSGATPWIITEAPYNTDSTNPHTFDSMWEACNPHEHCYSSSLVSTRRRRAGWGETRIDMQLICIGGQTTSYI